MGIQTGDQKGFAASSRGFDPLVQKFGALNVLDDVIRHRASDRIQYPILAYPKYENDPASYSYYTGKQLDAMIDQAAAKLVCDGFQQTPRNLGTVAFLTFSDLNMVITFFAMSRLGYTVMMLSPRLSGEACASLLDQVDCHTIIYGQARTIETTIEGILQYRAVTCHPLIDIRTLQATNCNKTMAHKVKNSADRKHDVALILHSSGSTGSPKPMFLTHQALMTHPLRGPGFSSFNTLPWYHLHGLSTALQAMWMRKTAFMWNASLPLTGKSVVAALEEAQPQMVAAVPYMLQILVASPGGVEALRKCELVTYGGAPCPDKLGDCLVREGVTFGGSFGCTEAGLVADSISRPATDPYWNYLKFFENLRPNIWMKPVGDSLYECVYLSNHKALTTSNSNEPPGSFHSKDVFTPHPTIPHRWKYVSRMDDRITLLNGEKILPLKTEGLIKQDPLIHEAVLVGVGKSTPGLLLFRQPGSEFHQLSDDGFLEKVWPRIHEANILSEQFSQISRDMVVIHSYDANFPRTDKGSMIRAKVYSRYAQIIDALYSSVEKNVGKARLNSEQTQILLKQMCKESLDVTISTETSNFFSAGVDSLKALQLRRLILQTFEVNKEDLTLSAIYESGCISQLAEHICSSQNAKTRVTNGDDIASMRNMIHEYSNFKAHTPQKNPSQSKSVILTGATGSIGAHTLYELLKNDAISTIYCLTRQSSPFDHVQCSLAMRNLKVTTDQLSRIVALKSSLDQPMLGLDRHTFDNMQETVTHIIHAAWPVDFNMPLSHFESHIHGLQNLIQLSLSVRRPRPATLLFCSSISTTLRSPSIEVPENLPNLPDAYLGYGQSKLIGEHIVSLAHRAGAQAYSLRIGQVSGHSKQGLWNDKEALPLMIRSALTLGALPDLHETCSWLPVDKLAAIIVELMNACSAPSGEPNRHAVQDVERSIYNVCNPRKFSWSILLHSLKRNGFQFEIVPFDKWLHMLWESESRGEEYINPAVKLIEFYESAHGMSGDGQGEQKSFITEKAEHNSTTLRNGRLRIIEDGILNCYIRDWLTRWMTSHQKGWFTCRV